MIHSVRFGSITITLERKSSKDVEVSVTVDGHERFTIGMVDVWNIRRLLSLSFADVMISLSSLRCAAMEVTRDRRDDARAESAEG